MKVMFKYRPTREVRTYDKSDIERLVQADALMYSRELNSLVWNSDGSITTETTIHVEQRHIKVGRSLA